MPSLQIHIHIAVNQQLSSAFKYIVMLSLLLLTACNTLNQDQEKAWERLEGIDNIKLLKDSDGVIYESITVLPDGTRHGMSETYYPDGRLASRKEYLDGLRQGRALYYYPSGEIKIHIDFVDDLPEGEYRSFYKDGTLKRTKDFVYGNPVGESTSYFANKAIQSVRSFEDGKLHGEAFFYNTDGHLIKMNRYVRGKLYETKYPDKGK